MVFHQPVGILAGLVTAAVRRRFARRLERRRPRRRRVPHRDDDDLGRAVVERCIDASASKSAESPNPPIHPSSSRIISISPSVAPLQQHADTRRASRRPSCRCARPGCSLERVLAARTCPRRDRRTRSGRSTSERTTTSWSCTRHRDLRPFDRRADDRQDVAAQPVVLQAGRLEYDPLSTMTGSATASSEDRA